MKKFTLYSKMAMAVVMITATLLTSLFSTAQVVRAYGSVYSNTLKGGHTMFGNSITAIYSSGSGSTGTINSAAMNDFSTSGTGSYSNGRTSAYGNDNSNIQLVDVDGDAATTSSSAADLILPAGTNNIKFARLYWGGRISSGNGGAANINLRSVKIRKGTSGAYTSVVTAATLVDKVLVSGSGSDSAYQAYADITGFVSAGGAGTYTVGNITAATGSISNGGHFAGWAIVVVYENPALPYSSVRVYDGFIQVYNGGNPVNQSVVLTGFNVPSNPLVAADAYMSTLSWEGDANLAASVSTPGGDYLKINGIAVSNAVNPGVNMWNGTVSKNGSFITTKNPDFKNQMSIDLDEVEVGVGYGILGNATSVAIEFGTEADQYFPSLFAFTLKAKDPTVILDKIVQDAIAPFGILQTNELLTYTLSGSNQGPGIAYKTIITDTIPANVIYEPNTLLINHSPGFPDNSPQTDAKDADFAFKGTYGSRQYVTYFIGTGATSTLGGVLQVGETYAVSFKVRAPAEVNQLTTVSNTGRITAESITSDLFTDDGTAIIGPASGPTTVKLLSFAVKKEGNYAMLKWSTASEIRNDHFIIERGTDGSNFTGMGNVPGKGTVNYANYYQFSDPLNNTNSHIVYYRLRIVDIDGKNSFSNIIVLRMDGSLINNYTVYPNPFTNDIKLQIRSIYEEPVTIRFVNTAGLPALQRVLILQPGDNIITLKDLEVLLPGIYFMEIITRGGTTAQQVIKR